MEKIFQTIEKKKVVALWAGYFILLSAIIIIGSVSLFNIYDMGNMRYIIKESEEKENIIIRNNISSSLRYILSDLFILAESEELQNMLNNITYHNKVCRFFHLFSLEKAIYDQIRFIDQSGMEVCRINYNKGFPDIVDTEHLQDKKNRYYFKDSISLDYKDIFISPLDLNVEKGAIEIPLKPMIRFATPVFDEKKQKRGIVVLNYLAQNLLNEIKISHSKQTTHSDLENIFLVNSEGYYFNHPFKEKNWGFMYDDENRTFKSDYPDAWKKITAADSGHFETPEGIVTFSTVYPYEFVSHTVDAISSSEAASVDYYWKLISFIPAEYLQIEEKKILNRYIFADSLILSLLFFVSFFLAYLTVHRIKIENDLHETNKKLLEADITKNKFFSILAHDLRTPFTGLIGFSELLYKKIDNLDKKTMVEYAQIIFNSSKTALDLVNNLLIWGRLQMGAQDLEQTNINITSIINNTVNLCHTEMDHKQITIENSIEKDFYCFGDSNMISFIVRNILTNAIKFTPTGGKISISAVESDNYLTTTISDNGIGISPENLEKLFKINEHLTTLGTQNEKGSGLGLILCKEFIEKNGGTISVTSHVGEGSTFKVSLPVK